MDESAASDIGQLEAVNQRLHQAREYYRDESNGVGEIINHMADLLHSFVKEESPEQQSIHMAILSSARAALPRDALIADQQLRMVVNFSIMLSEGLEHLGNKLAYLQTSLDEVAVHKSNKEDHTEIDKPPTTSSSLPRVLVDCDLCSRLIPRMRYANHLRVQHPEQFSKIAHYSCLICNRAKFINKSAYISHIQTCPDIVEKRQAEVDLRTRLIHGNCTCGLCGSVASDAYAHAAHMVASHPDCQAFMCSICGKMFRTPPDLLAHWSAERKNKNLTCGILGTMILNLRPKLIKQQLHAARMVGRLEAYKYVRCMTQVVDCPFCEAKCKSMDRLYCHVSSKHLKNRKRLSFACDGCGIIYRCPSGLKDHLLKSEFEGRTKCENKGVVRLLGSDHTKSEKENVENSDEKRQKLSES